MLRVRRRFEKLFEALARGAARSAGLVIGLFAVGTAALGSQVVSIRVDTSPEAMLRAEDSRRLDYAAFRDEFGHDQMILVGVPAPPAFDEPFLVRLEALHRDLESEVPYLSEVTSLVDVRFTRGEDDALVVGTLLEDWRAAGGDAASLQRMAVDHPLYRDNLVSRSGNLVTIAIETLALVREDDGSEEDLLAGFGDPESADLSGTYHYITAAEKAEVVSAVRDVLAKHERPDFVLLLTGTPVILEAFDRVTLDDLARCATASLIGISLLLAWFFRRASGVLLPNLVVSLTNLVTFGLMGLMGSPYTLMMSAVIPVLFAVGTCSSVHLLTVFYRRLEAGEGRVEALTGAMGYCGPAILMTGITTAAGLFSFALADLHATAEVGRYASAGVLFCMLFSLGLLPAVLTVVPIRPDVRNPAGSQAADRLLRGVARFATRHYRPILVCGALVLVLSVEGLTRVRFAHDPVSYFPEGSVLRRDLEHVDRDLGAGHTLELVIDSGRRGGVVEPELLAGIEATATELAERTAEWLPVTRFFAVHDIVKETHQALHDNSPDHYRIPESREALSQELFLFEASGSEDLDRLVDTAQQRARLSIVTPHADGMVYRDFVEEARGLFAEAFSEEIEVTATGGMAIEVHAISAALESMAESYVVAFVVISLLMILFLGSFKLGLLSMVPNLLPIVAGIGLMGWLGAPLDMTSITIGSIGLGLVVDDTIHFLHGFQKHHRDEGDVTRATEAAFLGAGRAMVVTTFVLVACFGVDLLATLSNVVRFGLFVSIIAVLALASDLLVAPALLRWVHEHRQATPGRASPLQASGLGLFVVAALLLAPGKASALEAREIMERVEAREDGDRMSMEIEMHLVDRRGRVRVRRARSFSQERDGGEDSILFFLEPADVRETGFLTLDHSDPERSDEQYLFLPALGRSKRISSSEKSRPFMGSDFSYADLSRRSIERYDYRLLGEHEVRETLTWLIESKPRDESEAEETGYEKSLLFVRQDTFMVVRAIHFLAGSDERKYMDVKRMEEIDGIWTPLEVHMSTRRGKDLMHRTILRRHDVRYDVEIPDHTFTTRRLEKGL